MKFKRLSLIILFAIFFNIFIITGYALANVIELDEIIVESFEDKEQYNEKNELRVLIELQENPLLELGSYSKLLDKENEILQSQRDIKMDIRAKGIDIEYIDNFTTVFNGFSGFITRDELEILETHPMIKRVYISQEYERPETVDIDEEVIIGYNLSEDKRFQGQGMLISIIDTGIDYNHKDMKITDVSTCKLSDKNVNSIISSDGLQGKYYTKKVPYGYNYFDQNHILLDLGPYASEHGMHVAGIAAANGEFQGVAPEAQILAMKVFSNNPSFPSTFEDIYIKAIEDSIKLGADVINLSLGTPSGFYYEKSPIDKALSLAMEKGILVSISAGNSGHISYGWKEDPYMENPDIGTVSSPSLYKNTLSVAAAGISSNDGSIYMADFSSFGTGPSLELKPEITANGVNIYSTLQGNRYGKMSGTSMSSPYIAGSLAKTLQFIKNKDEFSNMIQYDRSKFAKNLLMNTATILYDSLNEPYSPRRQGAGLMNFESVIDNPVILLDGVTKEPKIELKDFKEKFFDLNIEAINYSDKDIVYDIEVIVLGDEIYNNDNGDYDRNMLRVATIEGSVINKPDVISISGNSKENITISVDFENGKIPGIGEDIKENMFIEGFVILKDREGIYPEISIPYVGFYGDWFSRNNPKILDGMDKLGYKSYYKSSGMIDGEKRYLGNAPGIGYNGAISRIAISPDTNSDIKGAMPVLSFLRNVEEAQYNILSKDYKLLRRLTTEKNIRKSYYNKGNGNISSLNLERYWDGRINNKVAEDGKYYYQIRCRLQGSDEWQETLIPITVDAIAPKTKIVYNKENKTITWESTDVGIGLSHFKVFVDGRNIYNNQVVVAKNGQDVYEISYDKGVNSDIEILAYDFAGNYTSSRFNINEDKEVPYVFITSPKMFEAIDSNKVEIKGYIHEDSEIQSLTINGENVKLSYNQESLRYDFTHILYDLEDGVQQLKIKVIDIYQNEIEYGIIFYIDTTSPTLEIDGMYLDVTVPLEIPGGGHSIIFGGEVYDKEFLINSKELMDRFYDALEKEESIYIKLDNGIYIDKNGHLVADCLKDQEIIYNSREGIRYIYSSVDGQAEYILIDTRIGDNLGIFRLFANDSEIYIHELDSMLNLKPIYMDKEFSISLTSGLREINLMVEDLAGNITKVYIRLN